jgi:MarR family transcriptional regulator, 2-MHQ and catechol-resistance regulon repressor
MSRTSSRKASAASLPATTAELPDEQRVALKLWVTLARAYAAIAREAQDDVRADSLSIGEFAVLELLFHKGPTLLGEIQKGILVSSGGITYLVDKLVQKGVVERRGSPNDRRARYAALTRDGERLMRRIFPRHARRITRAMRALSPAQQREVTQLLKVLGLGASSPMGGESG